MLCNLKTTVEDCLPFYLLCYFLICYLLIAFKIGLMSEWYKKKVKGVLLDITGVLKDSGPGGGFAIDGSIEAVKRLVYV